MKNQNIIILSFATAMFLAGCSNVEAKQGNNTSIESKTTITTTEASNTTSSVVTPSEMSSTSASESIPVISDEITTTTTENKTTTSTSTEKVESSTTLETTKKPSTVTTTTKATTTKKPATVTTTNKATTTTKKATTTTRKVTTTTKKTTTTATTTKKTTTTTSKADTLTQADIDKLVAELQEYSNSKAVGYKQYFPEGGKISYEEALEYDIATMTPYNSSWDAPVQVSVSKDYSTAYAWIKDEIETDYLTSPNCHVVVYVMWCPDGFVWEGEQYTDFPCWTFFCLR